jgi:GDP-D-mannose 3', 5'-epimerase
MKKALVCGAGGFIGGHLVAKLKREGYWVRGVDVKAHEFRTLEADDFQLLDLREAHNCWQALSLGSRGNFDEVYQLAADMGGMGFIHTAECDIMHNSALINVHMIDAAVRMGVARYFFSSSACVYPDMKPGDPQMNEDQVIPANPDNEYGWEKLYAERMAMAYARHYPIEVRIARFQNCYGPYGTWRGGREKAPAAICRKVAMAETGGAIDVWGDGKAVRGFTYIDDLVDGIYLLAQSDLRLPANIGTDQYVTVNDLVETVIEISGKDLEVQHVDGPVGVLARNFNKARMRSLGWEARVSLREGLERTYPWIAEQVKQAYEAKA